MLDSPNHSGYSWSFGTFKHARLLKYSSRFAEAKPDVGKYTLVFQVVSMEFG